MGNHLVKDSNNDNRMRTLNVTSTVPSDELTKFFIETMKYQQDIDKFNKPFYLNQRRACCMGVVEEPNLDEKAIAIKIPYYMNDSDKCPLNYIKDGDKYKMGSNVVTEEFYNNLKIENCLAYKDIAVHFDMKKSDCINKEEENSNYFHTVSRQGETEENGKCEDWMKWHCSKAAFNQGCLAIKLDKDGNKVRTFDINRYGCGAYDEASKTFKDNVNPNYAECSCINDFNGFTYRMDPSNDSRISSLKVPYPLEQNELEPENKSSIYSLNVNDLPRDKIPIDPTKNSKFCNSTMFDKRHNLGQFKGYLTGQERKSRVEVNCINIMQFKNIKAKEINMSGINQVNNCGADDPANKKIQEENKKALEDLKKEGTNPAPPEEQEKIDKQADKSQRTNDAKENTALESGKEQAEADKKQEEDDKKRILEEKARIEKEEKELLEKAEALKKAKGQVDEIVEKKDIDLNGNIEKKSLIDEILEDDQKLLIYGGGIISIFIIIIILIIALRR